MYFSRHSNYSKFIRSQRCQRRSRPNRLSIFASKFKRCGSNSGNWSMDGCFKTFRQSKSNFFISKFSFIASCRNWFRSVYFPWICESGFGQSKQSIKQHNYFGLRGKYSRKKKSSFKHYARPEDSMVDFCEVLASKKYYTNLKGNPDPMKWTRAMAKARYAANAKRWIRLMKKSFTLID